MARFFVDVGITLLLFLPVFCLVFAVLWRLKSKGAYTLLLGFFFEVVFLFAGYAIAPHAMRYHRGHGVPPVVEGMMMGCCMPMVYMMLYYMVQDQKKRKKTP